MSRSRADATHDAVHILSIHSAKGLEWPVVIPINLVTAMRSPTGVLHRATDDTLHFGMKTLNPPEYDLLKNVENRELDEERIRLLYVACTRARDLLVFPHYQGKLGNGWYKQVDLSLHDLPKYPDTELTKGERKPIVPPLNEQTAEIFRHEASKLVEQTRNMRWIQPSAVEIEEIPLTAPPEDEFAEPIPDVRGSAARGRILHKLMEEFLLDETRDGEAGLQTRAAELLRQLGENDHPDPSKGPSSQEIASTIGRTLQLPIVAQYCKALKPEFGVFHLRSTETDNPQTQNVSVKASCPPLGLCPYFEGQQQPFRGRQLEVIPSSKEGYCADLMSPAVLCGVFSRIPRKDARTLGWGGTEINIVLTPRSRPEGLNPSTPVTCLELLQRPRNCDGRILRSVRYSYRSATVGSTRAARRAGT